MDKKTVLMVVENYRNQSVKSSLISMYGFIFVIIFLVAICIFFNLKEGGIPNQGLMNFVTILLIFGSVFLAFVAKKEVRRTKEKMNGLIELIEGRSEKELEKTWQTEDGVPLIKTEGKIYILPTDEDYKDIVSRKMFYSEIEALLAFYFPKK